ncbi:RING finger protein 17 [Thalassophryne amazonica]|uniref:RING finger protein 17 n=1 Tax=Thalassophryne amazonica TaxID=390379 RepID=UPI00147266C1|nr:RING finger protein 17 [Thalassophryne amazonica]
MDSGPFSNAVICKYCGNAFTLPEEEVEGNLPRLLLCGHIYCTSCLCTIECDRIIRCPECEVESSLPEGGVCGLQEDSRIIGLIYTAKMNKTKSMRRARSGYYRKVRLSLSPDRNDKIEEQEQATDAEELEKALDEALVLAADNLAQLEHIYETLTAGLEEQIKCENDRLELEIKQKADMAVYTVKKWKEEQVSHLPKLLAHFSTTQAEVSHVKERITALEIGIKMAKEVRRVPFLQQHCSLKKVLETLQAPVLEQSFDMDCVKMDSGIRYSFSSEGLNQNVTIFLSMEDSCSRLLPVMSSSQTQPEGRSSIKSPCQLSEGYSSSRTSAGYDKLPRQQNQATKSPEADRQSLLGSFPSPRPRHRNLLACQSAASNLGSPDVLVDQVLHEEKGKAPPPTGPEMAHVKGRMQRKRLSDCKRNVCQWVLLSHVVNPTHFYVRYMAEKREGEILSQKINQFCCKDDSFFSSSDTLETGSLIFVKWKKGLWYRARVIKILQSGCIRAVKASPVTQLASVRVFLLDYGPIKFITFESEHGNPESLLKVINVHLKKFDKNIKEALSYFAPQAIRCSLKDIVPYDMTKGWSPEAQVEFGRMVGSAAVQMLLYGQDGDSLLVDLKKIPVDQACDVPISVSEYLVFIEVARFYSPVVLGRRPLMFYPPVYPKIHRECDAVVCHINNPADFYIQMVDNMEFLLLSDKLQDCYNITEELEDDDLKLYCPVIGQACVARYDDKSWYRAQVIGHPGGRKVEVLYVDFGNKKIVPVSELRKIKDEFFALPSKAVRCCLSGLVPLDEKTWTDACINRFISLAYQKLVIIVATEPGSKTKPLPIKMFESSLSGPQANIAALLVKEELACFKESSSRGAAKDQKCQNDEPVMWDPPLYVNYGTEGVDPSDQMVSGDEEQSEFQPQLQVPAVFKNLKVRITHINSPSSFFVQLTKYDCQLKRICELLKQEYANAEPQDMEWEADMYCAAHINDVWERGQICSIDTVSKTAQVMRCDYGNKVKVHINNLQPLSASLVGSFVLECTLTDIRPAGGLLTWTATACDFISYYLTGASAVMTIKELTDERPVPVTLQCTNKMGQLVSIADCLASEGLALKERKPRDVVNAKPEETAAEPPRNKEQTQRTDVNNNPSSHQPSCAATPVSSPIDTGSIPSSTSTHPKPAPRSILSAEMVKTKLYQPPELPCLGHIQMTVTAVGDDGLIYTRTQHTDCQLEQLRERIQQNMKMLPNQRPYTWKSVLGCAIIGPDMLWYRGRVLEVLGAHVKVQYVDCGNVENIPVVHVYPVLLCPDVPQLCIPCELHGVNPVGGKWHGDAVALLKELLLGRCVDVVVKELPTDLRGSLKVEIFLDDMSLSRILHQQEHVSMDQTVSAKQRHTLMPADGFLDEWDLDTKDLWNLEEPTLGPFIRPQLPPKGEELPVKVKHLLTPNELYLWPSVGSYNMEINGETLNEALSRINRDISSLPRLTNFPPGGPCLAEYSDGIYYRAKLMKFTSMEPVTLLVHHVDFGSDDTLPTSKLRQMPAELLRFPVQALRVHLMGFKPPAVRPQDDVLPYSPRWSMKAVIDMIDLLHGTITASVVAQEPELKVLLYKDGELIHLPLVKSGLAELDCTGV